ncbi:MAG: hypothetical protein Ta2A_14620 [Treponemataceae bacterium]|nr:MAG: hypothetical protein Ta2A_14620 [Treponemataceae bacterium]
MKKFNLVHLLVMAMVAIVFMGCTTFVPLTDTGWMQYPEGKPTATIKLGGGFSVWNIEKVSLPTSGKNKDWSPITVPANTKLAIYGNYWASDSFYNYSGRNTFNCPPLSEGKTYTLRVYNGYFLSVILQAKMKYKLSFVLYDEEGNWVVQQMMDTDEQIFNDKK